MKRLCTICARGGSKGVHGKNIKDLLGYPLIVYTISQAKQSGLFDVIAVSSDSMQILDIAKEWGINYLIKRPKVLASDEASKLPAISHCLQAVEKRLKHPFDTIVDLDVTSPLRDIEDIKRAVSLLEENGVSSVLSVTQSRKSPYFNMVEIAENGQVQLSKKVEGSIVRRQDAPKSFDMNASIYCWNRDAFLKEKTLFYADTKLYEMPLEKSIDIDSEIDFLFVEFLMEKKVKTIG